MAFMIKSALLGQGQRACPPCWPHPSRCPGRNRDTAHQSLLSGAVSSARTGRCSKEEANGMLVLRGLPSQREEISEGDL